MAIEEADRLTIDVDQGMKAVPGSPEVATIMFEKIGESGIFVGDVSLVGSVFKDEVEVKKVPNPNVNIEEGFAAGVLGWERVICVANKHFGTNEQQAFDQRNRRFPINYELKPGATAEVKAGMKQDLVKDFKNAIKTVEKYELRKAEKAAERLDVHSTELILSLNGEEFIAPAKPQSESPVVAFRDLEIFHRCVIRLLDLRIIFTNLGVDGDGKGRYSYRWTMLGKEVVGFVKKKVTIDKKA
jgi:hypothetical protein